MVDVKDRIANRPQLQIEDALLGCLFLDNNEIVNVVPVVNSDMFQSDVNKRIYNIVCNLFERKIVADKITVWQEVLNNGWNNALFTENHVSFLSQGGGVFSSNNAKHYAEALELKFVKEKAPEILYNAYLEAKERPASVEETISMVNKNMLKLLDLNSGKKEFFKLSLDMDSMFKDIDDKIEGKICTGFETGIWEIDKSINGLERGRVYNFTGAPGTGKTIFALQVALHNALQGNHVLYGSFEMGVDELTTRLICMQQNLNSWAIDDPSAFISNLIERGRVSTFEEGREYIKRKIKDGYDAIKDLPMEIFRPDSPDIAKVKMAIDKYLIQNKRLDILIVDHTDLMHNHQNAPADLYVIYKRLKDYSVNYKIAVLALHQFNREQLVNAKDFKPTVFALKGGQAIHDNADVIMLLHRPGIFKSLIAEKPELKDVCQVDYAKRRGGKQQDPSDLKFNGIKFNSELDILAS